MANITHKLAVGGRVQFRPDAFRSRAMREWSRDTLQIERIKGRDVRVINLRTGEDATVDIDDLRPDSL